MDQGRAAIRAADSLTAWSATLPRKGRWLSRSEPHRNSLCAATRAASRNVAIQLVTLAVIAGLADGAIFDAVQNLTRAHIASGFGFWNNTAGFDISQTLISYSPSHLDLRPCLLGRSPQYAARRRHRHRARDGARLCRRYCPAVAQLARCAARRRLCRDNPQCAAAAAAPVLVQRGAQIVAGIARQRCAPRRRHSQQSRPVPAAAGIRVADFRSCSLRSQSGSRRPSRSRVRRNRRQDRTGAEVPVLWLALGSDRRLATCRLCTRRLFRSPSASRIWDASMSAAALRSCRNSPRSCWRCRSTPRPSSPRSCAPACCRCRTVRSKPRRRSGFVPA